MCEACRSAVVRDGVDVEAIGRVSSFARDLSPVQVGARGQYEGRSFQVAGVLRKGRERVRWSEWYLVFDDGRTGWLGEGNGLLQIFLQAPSHAGLPAFQQLRLGEAFAWGDAQWQVIEVAQAADQAAEGELPFRVFMGQLRPYADLRERGGSRTGTLDYADGPAAMWVGEVTSLPALKMEGLRPFTGWSDPALTAFAGPEVSASRALQCPCCSAAISLRAPGQSVRLVCAYCGSDLSVGESVEGATTLALLEAHDAPPLRPALALGSKGELDGAPWEIIGVMTRYVVVEGMRYTWMEHLLHNPYRGFRWLVWDTTKHWNLVETLGDVPSVVPGGRVVVYKGTRYRHFQGGIARTDKVMGEFTWEVHAGDTAKTADFIAPPHMLSFEATADEQVWSRATWLPHETVRDAFGVQKLSAPDGVAPNQPNPLGAGLGAGEWAHAGVLLSLAVLFWLVQSFLSANEVLLTDDFLVTSAAEDVFVSSSFMVPDGERRGLMIEVGGELSRDDALVHVAVVNKEDGTAMLPDLDGVKGDVRVRGATPGESVVRLEVAKSPVAITAMSGKQVTLEVRRDVPWRPFTILAVLMPFGIPLALALARGAFESRRWANSDHA